MMNLRRPEALNHTTPHDLIYLGLFFYSRNNQRLNDCFCIRQRIHQKLFMGLERFNGRLRFCSVVSISRTIKKFMFLQKFLKFFHCIF